MASGVDERDDDGDYDGDDGDMRTKSHPHIHKKYRSIDLIKVQV